MDLAGYVTGMHISAVNADMATFLPVRKKPRKSVETWSGKVLKNEDYDEVTVNTEDYATVMFHSAEGVQGVFTVNQMAAATRIGSILRLTALKDRSSGTPKIRTG